MPKQRNHPAHLTPDEDRRLITPTETARPAPASTSPTASPSPAAPAPPRAREWSRAPTRHRPPEGAVAIAGCKALGLSLQFTTV
jgi:hypothetical protein